MLQPTWRNLWFCRSDSRPRVGPEKAWGALLL